MDLSVPGDHARGPGHGVGPGRRRPVGALPGPGQLRGVAGSGGRIRAERGDAIGEAIALFSLDLARRPTQGRHLDYYWDGTRVTYVRDAGASEVYEIA